MRSNCRPGHDHQQITNARPGELSGDEVQMYIVMIASECAPVVQVGGLAEVVSGLSRELQTRGNTVEIILPKYDGMRFDRIWDFSVAWEDLWVPWQDDGIRCVVYFGHVNGLKCYFIEPHPDVDFFRRPGTYGYGDDPMRFAFFSKAALEFMLRANKRPDVIHCHDWPTGLVPVLLFEIYQHGGMRDQRVCFTMHNFRHQGLVGPELLQASGLGRSAHYHHHDRLRDNFHVDALNLAKAGIVYSNAITTVSHRHRWEVLNSYENFGLGETLWNYQGKFTGILNGVDYQVWNPEIDPLIPSRYGVETLDRKRANKRALRDRFWLRDSDGPIVAYVGRLDSQKGVDLVRHALFRSLALGGQFVLLGPGTDPAIHEDFLRIRDELNDNPDCHLELRFDADLSHLIYAGADLLVVPSRFEPCGLVQMIALRYGTVPVVRWTGGLADTVIDRDYPEDARLEPNGYVFHHADETGIESALDRAFRLWHDRPNAFRGLMRNGMLQDHSWNRAAGDYLRVYEHVRHK
jgi:starch synthase